METSGASTPSSSPPHDLNDVWGMPQKNYSYFNFVVAERTKYIPGSGPPLQPVTAALKHDKTGYILEKVFFKKELRYLVGFKDKPQLRVSVRPQNILDWVSEWEAENWEERDFIQKEKQDEELLLPFILAREARKQKKMDEKSREGVKIDGRKRKRSGSPTTQIPRKKVGTGRGRGRPPLEGRLTTKMSSLPGPGGRNQTHDEPATHPFTSPKSQRRISRGLAHIVTPLSESDDSESDEELEDVDAAINAQLNNVQTDQGSESPDPLIDGGAGSAVKSHVTAAGAFRGRTSSNFVDRSSVATVSAYEAGQMWDSLTKKAEHSTKITQAPSSQPAKYKQTTLPLSNNENAMMKRFVRENELRANRSLPRPVQENAMPPPILIEPDQPDMDGISKAMQFSKRPQSTFPPTTNLLQNQIHRSQVQLHKYKSPFDKPILNKTHISPYDDMQGSGARQSSVNQAHRNTSVVTSLVASQPRVQASVLQTANQDEYMIDVSVDVGDSDDENEEYNVESILDVETRIVDGRPVRYYLIKWEGDWENTWEPQENVGDAAIAEFKATKRIIASQNPARFSPGSTKQTHAPTSSQFGHAARKNPSPNNKPTILPRAAGMAQSTPSRESQNSIPVANQTGQITSNYNKPKFPVPQVWKPSSGGDKNIANNPKCPPCMVYTKGHCYGGVPCQRCKERGLSAEMCVGNADNIDRLSGINSFSRGAQSQIREHSTANKMVTMPLTNGTSNDKQAGKPAPVVVISSDEEDGSSSESEQSHAAEAESPKQRQ